MAYASEDYYFDTFDGSKIADDDVESNLKLASMAIDDATFNRIEKIGFDNLTEYQQECVQQACCYEAEYIYENGYENIGNTGIASYSALDISVQYDTEKTEAQKRGLCNTAWTLIKRTGLGRPVAH